MRTKMIASILKTAGIATAALALVTVLTASPAAARGHREGNEHGDRRGDCVPEIDPGAAGSALSLVLGGVAMLADRRRKG